MGGVVLTLFVSAADTASADQFIAGWPHTRFRQVAILAILLGAAYTVFSEWFNVVVRAAWAYSDHMPVISLAGVTIGLSPLLQWVVVPVAAFKIMKRLTCVYQKPKHGRSDDEGRRGAGVT